MHQTPVYQLAVVSFISHAAELTVAFSGLLPRANIRRGCAIEQTHEPL